PGAPTGVAQRHLELGRLVDDDEEDTIGLLGRRSRLLGRRGRRLVGLAHPAHVLRNAKWANHPAIRAAAIAIAPYPPPSRCANSETSAPPPTSLKASGVVCAATTSPSRTSSTVTR